MSVRNIVMNIAFGLVLFGSLFGLSAFDNYMKWLYASTLNLQLRVASGLVYVLVGLILGMDQFIRELRTYGHWNIEISRLIFLGLPGLYFSLYPFIHFYVHFLTLPPSISMVILSNGLIFFNVACVILGYVLISSFYKKNN